MFVCFFFLCLLDQRHKDKCDLHMKFSFSYVEELIKLPQFLHSIMEALSVKTVLAFIYEMPSGSHMNI
jgi:hypothetical protein